jgi:hypothetical protein
MGIFTRFFDQLRGGGEFSVTVPPMDGALNPDNRLEEAHLVVSAAAPDNLARVAGKTVFSSGAAVLEIDPNRGSASAKPYATLDAPVACLAGDGSALAIGLSGRILVHGGPHDGFTLSSVGGRPVLCPTALAFAGPHTLLLCLGSDRHAPEAWKHDLMDLGAGGSVWRIDLRDGKAALVGDRLAYPYGVMVAPDGAVIVSESWRHRLLKFARDGASPEVVLHDLPAYPARISPAPDGKGAWLALFAPRRQLTEFVLREPTYRKRMMAEIPPDYWVGPTLAPMKSFLEPLQGGTLKKLAAIKPWAPSRSYGLVVRLDETWQPVASFHSRADGTRHGVASALEVDGRLLAASRGCDAVVAVDLAGE